MKNKLRNAIIETIELHSRYAAFAVRDKHGVVPSKVRVTVFFESESTMLETELKISIEAFENEYQDYTKRQIVEEAKKVIRDEYP